MGNSEKYDSFHPFVRCVGAASHLSQLVPHKAYDFRMIAVVKGNGFIETDDGRKNIESGNVFVISPSTSYRLVTDKDQRIIVINFDMTHSMCHIDSPVISVYAENFDESKIIEMGKSKNFFGESFFVKDKASAESLRICETILDVYTHKSESLDDVYITGLFTQLSCLLIKGDKPVQKSNTASEIYQYITENSHLPITLESLSEKFHFHPSYINRLMQKCYRISVKQLLLKCRFDRALNLLDNTDMTVKEVANAAGFSNPQYFSEAFFNRFGHYPTVYRK